MEIRKPALFQKANSFTFYGPYMECTSAAKNSLQEHDRMEKVNTKALTFVSLSFGLRHHFSGGDLLETTFSHSTEFKLFDFSRMQL